MNHSSSSSDDSEKRYSRAAGYLQSAASAGSYPKASCAGSIRKKPSAVINVASEFMEIDIREYFQLIRLVVIL